MPNIITKHGKDGRITYQAVVRVDVRRPVKKTFPTYEEAEAWRAAKDAELRANLAQPAYNFQLAEILDDYSTYYPNAAIGAIRGDLSGIMDKTADNIDPVSLENLSDATLAVLESVIEHGRKYLGVVIAENPAAVLQGRRAGLPFRPITAYEEERIIEDASGLANGALRDVLILAFDTAMAQNEILGLAAAQVDMRHGLIRMSGPRTVKLTARAKEALAKRMASHKGALFPDIAPNTVQTAFIRLKKSIGINGPSFHDIRKLAIIRLSERMPIHELKEALGYARYDSLQWLLDLPKKAL